MLSENIYILKLNSEQIADLVGFGYSATSIISTLKGNDVFSFGVIHKYGIFCKPDKTIYIDTIQYTKFGEKEHQKYYKMLDKVEKNSSYKYYQGDLQGYPILNNDNVLSPHFL